MNQQVDNAIGGFVFTVPWAEYPTLATPGRLLSDAEYKALLRPNAEPRPEAERRVYPIENHGRDKPFNHADRRRVE
jgi:hypothetical protein